MFVEKTFLTTFQHYFVSNWNWKHFQTFGREPTGTLTAKLTRAPSLKRHLADTPDTSVRTDAQVKQFIKTIAHLSDKMQRLEEIAHDLVKKNNSDNDINAERERAIKASLRAANKTIAILRTSCQDTHLLDILTPEKVPASTAKL